MGRNEPDRAADAPRGPAPADADAQWPPRDAREYVHGESFARLIERTAVKLQRRYPALELVAAVGLVWDWFDRRASEQPDSFFAPFAGANALEAYVRQALWRAAANEARRQRSRPLEPIPTSVDLVRDPAADAAASTIDTNELIDVLPPREARVVRAILFEGYNVNETAALIGASRWQVGRIFTRAIDTLRERLGE